MTPRNWEREGYRGRHGKMLAPDGRGRALVSRHLPDGYEDRRQKLKKSGIALWDVCLSGKREGSLDSRIAMSTVVANDFDTLLRTHPSIRLICFNGRTAEKLFQRKVNVNASGIRYELLPSSSAVYAITHERRLTCWRNILGSAISTD